MLTNRGTYEGDLQEIAFVRDFNKHKTDERFNLLTQGKIIENLYMVRVTTNQYSSLSGKITKTRADCYLIYSQGTNVKNILLEKDYYLCEQDLEQLEYEFIKHSGVSIKLQDSDKYQILKVGPYSFNAKYGDRVYNPNEVFMKRIKNGILVSVALVFVFLTQMSYLGIMSLVLEQVCFV